MLGSPEAEDGAVDLLVIASLLGLLALLGGLYGADTRFPRDRRDRYWWPNG